MEIMDIKTQEWLTVWDLQGLLKITIVLPRLNNEQETNSLVTNYGDQPEMT